MALDIIIRNAQLRKRKNNVDIGISKGKIVQLKKIEKNHLAKIEKQKKEIEQLG